MDYIEICVPLWDKYMQAHLLDIEVRSFHVRNIATISIPKMLAWSKRVSYLKEQSENAYRAYIDARDALDALAV